MHILASVFAAGDGSPALTAAFGLFGTLVGASVAAVVNWSIAKQNRAAQTLTARREEDNIRERWLLENRNRVYDRFLTAGQDRHVAIQDLRDAGTLRAARSSIEKRLSDAEARLMQINAVLQTIAQPPVVSAARVYTYRLEFYQDVATQRPTEALERAKERIPDQDELADLAADLLRDARHGLIAAIREELALSRATHLGQTFDPFFNTRLAGCLAVRDPEDRTPGT